MDSGVSVRKNTMTKTKLIISIVLPLTLVTLAGTKPLEAQGIKHENMQFEIGYKTVDRVEILENFFSKYNSPLRGNAKTFVAVADEYGIDYKLLPSISCMESTCGKNLIEGSYNPFGWGVYGNQHIAFDDYDHAIKTVGEGLHKNYFSKGFDTTYKIAPIYTPPNSNNWYRGVSWFEKQIDLVASNI